MDIKIKRFTFPTSSLSATIASVENEKKIGQLKTFDSLFVDEKIRAILGAVMEPVSKEMVYNFAGVNYAELDGEFKNKVDASFDDQDVEQSVGSEIKYRLNKDARKVLATEIDMESVHGVIADVLFSWWEEKKLQ